MTSTETTPAASTDAVWTTRHPNGAVSEYYRVNEDMRVTVVTMADGETRFFVSRYNGYGAGQPEGCTDPRKFGCAWSPSFEVTYSPAAVAAWPAREAVTVTGKPSAQPTTVDGWYSAYQEASTQANCADVLELIRDKATLAAMADLAGVESYTLNGNTRSANVLRAALLTDRWDV